MEANRQMGGNQPEEVLLNDVQHGLELTEEQDAVLADDWDVCCCSSCQPDAAVQQQLPATRHMAYCACATRRSTPIKMLQAP